MSFTMSSALMLSRCLLFSVLATHLFSCICSASSCFFPNGGTASNYTACSPTGDGSCCADGDFCTTSGYCVSSTKGYHYRGGCTDSTWDNPLCPNYCLAGTDSGNSSAVNVIACNAAQTGGTWCCAYDGNCCSSSTFTPSFGTVFVEGSTRSTASTGSSDKTAVIVGAAVGVPLGLLALAGLIFFVLERNKRKAIERDTTWDRSKLNTGSSSASTDFGPRPLEPPKLVSTGAPVYMRPYKLPSSPSDKNHELGI